MPDLDAATERRLRSAHTQFGGQIWTKVCLSGAGIGPWPTAAPLYLDAVMIATPSLDCRCWRDDPAQFDQAIQSGGNVTAAVARGYADRTIFGLLLAAQDLLGLRYPDLRSPIGGLALAERGRHDRNMDWVYHRHGFSVVEVEALETQ